VPYSIWLRILHDIVGLQQSHYFSGRIYATVTQILLTLTYPRASFAQKCLYWALGGLFDPFQVPLPLHYIFSEVPCKYQTMHLHHDDVQWIPPKGVAADVPRKVSTLPEVGHTIFWRTRLGSFFSLHHEDPMRPLFWAKNMSPKGSGQVPNKRQIGPRLQHGWIRLDQHQNHGINYIKTVFAGLF